MVDAERGQAMRLLRDFLGAPKESQTAWGQRLGVSMRTVQTWEAGTATPRPGPLKRILELLVAQAVIPTEAGFTLEQLVAGLTDEATSFEEWKAAFDQLHKPDLTYLAFIQSFGVEVSRSATRMGAGPVTEEQLAPGEIAIHIVGNPPVLIPATAGEIVILCGCGCRHRVRVSPAGMVRVQTGGVIEQIGEHKRPEPKPTPAPPRKGWRIVGIPATFTTRDVAVTTAQQLGLVDYQLEELQ